MYIEPFTIYKKFIYSYDQVVDCCDFNEWKIIMTHNTYNFLIYKCA